MRNRLKIESAIRNAKAFVRIQEKYGSFDSYIWQFVESSPKQNSWKDISQVPAKTPESDAMSKDLKKHGFNFVGSTICYAFMQSVGMVNDHTTRCFRHREIRELGANVLGLNAAVRAESDSLGLRCAPVVRGHEVIVHNGETNSFRLGFVLGPTHYTDQRAVFQVKAASGVPPGLWGTLCLNYAQPLRPSYRLPYSGGLHPQCKSSSNSCGFPTVNTFSPISTCRARSCSGMGIADGLGPVGHQSQIQPLRRSPPNVGLPAGAVVEISCYEVPRIHALGFVVAE